MKALTVCQPYAEWIARGEKRVENRTWRTHHVGDLLIHAGQSREWMPGSLPAGQFVYGAIIAQVTLVTCVRASSIREGAYDEKYPWLRLHEHVHGPWCWILQLPYRLDPIPCRGHLGLWDFQHGEDLR